MMTCPHCGSIDIDETTMGWVGPPSANPNRMTCQGCKRHGQSRDWHLIAELRKPTDPTGRTLATTAVLAVVWTALILASYFALR